MIAWRLVTLKSYVGRSATGTGVRDQSRGVDAYFPARRACEADYCYILHSEQNRYD